MGALALIWLNSPYSKAFHIAEESVPTCLRTRKETKICQRSQIRGFNFFSKKRWKKDLGDVVRIKITSELSFLLFLFLLPLLLISLSLSISFSWFHSQVHSSADKISLLQANTPTPFLSHMLPHVHKHYSHWAHKLFLVHTHSLPLCQ